MIHYFYGTLQVGIGQTLCSFEHVSCSDTFCCRMYRHYRVATKHSERLQSRRASTSNNKLQFETVNMYMVITAIPANGLELYRMSYAVRSAILATAACMFIMFRFRFSDVADVPG